MRFLFLRPWCSISAGSKQILIHLIMFNILMPWNVWSGRAALSSKFDFRDDPSTISKVSCYVCVCILYHMLTWISFTNTKSDRIICNAYYTVCVIFSMLFQWNFVLSNEVNIHIFISSYFYNKKNSGIRGRIFTNSS